VLVVDEGVNRQQLDARHAEFADVFEQFVVGQAGEGAAQFSGTAGWRMLMPRAWAS
jgi:hypothetical protein